MEGAQSANLSTTVVENPATYDKAVRIKNSNFRFISNLFLLQLIRSRGCAVRILTFNKRSINPYDFHIFF